MTAVTLDHLTKAFPDSRPPFALRDINLDVAAGELFFFLGPSGCGKSTLLRLVAGLHAPDSGQILFNGNDVTALGTERRNAVMCFQSYALWPHLSVRQNVAFGLDVRRTPRDEQRRRVDDVLRLVKMADFADRKPNQLSGGQQQRVALARAIAVNPALLLLDEPLSNLDAKFRHEMRSEIRRICKGVGITTLYVTHDQKEALSVADRIAVMKDGQITQVGTPADLYGRPRSAFVADFIGATNLLPGEIVNRDGPRVTIRTAAGEIIADADGQTPSAGPVTLSIRPEHLHLVAGGTTSPDAVNHLTGRVVETTFLGESSEHAVEVHGQRLKVVRTPPLAVDAAEVMIEFAPQDAIILIA